MNRAYATNGLNQYSAAGGTSFTYDSNGNLVEDGAIDYAYDIENRLVERSGGAVLTYDPLGRLFSVAGGSGTTQFLYDGHALVAEYVSGAMTQRYVHNVGMDTPLLSYAGTNLGTPSYLHADERGSIVAVADPWGAGAVNTYDEYGIPASTNVGRFQYTGQIWLPELGMYHYKARVYSPTLGRFMQTDPIGYGGGMNLYAYVGNNPVNWIDPEGLQEQEVIVTANSRFRPQNAPGFRFGNFSYLPGLRYQEPDFMRKRPAEDQDCEPGVDPNCPLVIGTPLPTFPSLLPPSVQLASAQRPEGCEWGSGPHCRNVGREIEERIEQWYNNNARRLRDAARTCFGRIDTRQVASSSVNSALVGAQAFGVVGWIAGGRFGPGGARAGLELGTRFGLIAGARAGAIGSALRQCLFGR